MHRGIPFIAVGLGLLTAVGSPAQAPDAGVKQKADPNNDDISRSFRGRILEITETTVTIRPEGFLKTVEYKQVGGVTVNARTYIQDNTRPPKTFVFSGDLLKISGLNPSYRGPIGSPQHLVTDLHVGDSVYLGFEPSGNTDYCTTIQIEGRLGGKVPPTVSERQELERTAREEKKP